MAELDRQHQTDFSPGRGNALQACAASLLERPLDEVPNFIASDDYWAAMLEDAGAHGLTLLKIPLADGRLQVTAAGLCRFEVVRATQTTPYSRADVRPLPGPSPNPRPLPDPNPRPDPNPNPSSNPSPNANPDPSPNPNQVRPLQP